MMKTRTIMLLACLAVVSTAWAKAINESQAARIATEFMASRAKPNVTLTMARKAPRLATSPSTDLTAGYYVFNAGKKDGFVIVAGDDNAPAVLGYSDSGTFDAEALPEAMQYLLEGYAAQIEALAQGAQAAPRTASHQAISPLVHAAWDQDEPYNILLPYVGGHHAAVGCVGTAMAQVMHYWQWPARPTQPIPAYTTSSLSIYMPELPVIDFDWSSMQDTYMLNDSTSAAGLAAATLSLYCDQALEMNFQNGGSGAYSNRLPQVMSTYYGYSAAARCLSRDNYSTREWNEIILTELAASRPVIYSGNKATTGHSFVCDGYDGQGLFHINWGWNGQSNGYFLLNVLNPDLQGTGSARGAYGYVYGQTAIVGIEPDNGAASQFALTASDMTLDGTVTSRNSSYSNFTARVSIHFNNYTSQTMSVDYGWGLYEDENMVSLIYSTYSPSLRPGYFTRMTEQALSFGSGLTSGTYRIVPVYSERYADNWHPCIGADQNFIEVTIDGNTCTFAGHGTAANSDYTVNDITLEGTLHHGRPVDINVNLTNNGDVCNNLLYLLVNGTFSSTALVSLEKGETGNATFRYLPTTAGTYTLTFSFNEDGSEPIATRTMTITTMPEANLSATIEVLNVTDNTQMIITDNKFSVLVTVTNEGATPYDEDFSVKLCKRINDVQGAVIQGKSQHLTLAPGATTTLQFDMDNVTNGWKYFAYTFYYSQGNQIAISSSPAYTVVFPEVPAILPGDVDGDGKVNLRDMSLLISYLLNGTAEPFVEANADMNGDNMINLRDMSMLIAYLLSAD